MPLLDLLLLRPQAFYHACEQRRAPMWISAFLLLFGVVYGSWVGLLQYSLGGELQGITIASIPLWVLVVGNIIIGILIAILVHLGVTLVAWLMAKAVGGPGYMGALYRTSGYLLPLTLSALPALAFNTAVTTIESVVPPTLPLLYLLLAIVGVAWFLGGLYQSLRVTQELTPRRTLFAVLLFAAFTASIMRIA